MSDAAQDAAKVELLAEVPFLQFLDDKDRAALAADLDVVRFPAGRVLFNYGDPGDSLYVIRSGEVVVEPYLITLTEEAKPYTMFQHVGVEFIYMLTGKVLYRHADKAYPLVPGDALFFDAAALHGPEELTKLPMTYLSIIIYPRS